VLTSSNSNQLSYESKEWENGAFTKVLLRAFGKDADADRNGLISTTELTSYLSDQLPRLTQNKAGRNQPWRSDSKANCSSAGSGWKSRKRNEWTV
jgi:uncharacterized caspase-like protein